MKSVAKNPKPIVEESIVDKVGIDNAIGRAKFQVDSQMKSSKSKNMIRPCLAKLHLLLEPSFRPGFLTSRARLVFAELRQVFIKMLILYHFDAEYYIRVEINISDYTISGALSQLPFGQLGPVASNSLLF